MSSTARLAVVAALVVATFSWAAPLPDPAAMVQQLAVGVIDPCGPEPAPSPDSCFLGWWCNRVDLAWEEEWAPVGTACNDGNACTTGETCGGAGCGGGTYTCVPPGMPGPITGPATSSTGSFTLSWGAAAAAASYELRENGAATYTTPGPSAVLWRTDGTYRYDVRACNSTGCSAYTAQFAVTVFRIPAAPAPISAPSTSGGAYTVSWTKPAGYVVDSYTLERKTGSGAWAAVYTGPQLSYAETQTADGVYSYRASARNSAGASSPTGEVSVTVELQLTETLPDAPVVQPVVPAQQFVGTGTIHGAASVEGGAVTYAVKVEVPPGRAGMQPEVALTYSSRNGNGIAGVGWSLSGTSTIYRCPRTLAQDGGNAPVQLRPEDRLCFDGRRLLAVNSWTYGQLASEYRTEIDPVDRITLQGGDMSSWSSYFVVEHKSGRISRYEPLRATYPGPAAPSTWYRVVEYDRAFNCISYRWTASAMGQAEERVLSDIWYTNQMVGSTCESGAVLAGVHFWYTNDRPDKRTTYQAGVGSLMRSRLAAITTDVTGGTPRRYELAYNVSAATGRSLLTAVTLCGGATCGAEKFAATTFAYQDSPPSSSMQRFKNYGPGWGVTLAGDYDGDGERDLVERESVSGAAPNWYLKLSTCSARQAFEGTPWLTPSGTPIGLRPGQGDTDATADGRADLIGVSGNPSKLTFASFDPLSPSACGTWDSWKPHPSTLELSPPAGSSAYGVDYDGDGLVDVFFHDAASGDDRVFRRLNRSLSFDGSGSIAPPAPPWGGILAQSRRDFNGDGLVDTFFDGAPDAMPAIALFKGPGAGHATFTVGDYGSIFGSILGPNLGGPTLSFSNFTNGSFRRWIDVNGDGLPDVFEFDAPSLTASVYVNRGGAIGSKLFSKVNVTRILPGNGLLANNRRAARAFAMDVDSDGQEELLLPSARVLDFCYYDPTKVDPKTHEPPYLFCGADFDRGDAPDLDHSVFDWVAYKFRELADGSFEMYAGGADLVARVDSFVGPDDYFGDGMPAVTYHLINYVNNAQPWYPSSYYPGLSDADTGLYVSRGPLSASAPDLLIGSTDGLGASASWSYQPLSRAQPPAGCNTNGDVPFYVAHHNGERSPDYVFFTSSMWAVSKVDVSNGIGTGMNTTCYRYEDAMLNTAGRGFQGFKRIVSEERLAPALGEIGSLAGTCSPNGCSVNNRRTTTEFNQEFPFASKPRRIATGVVQGDGTEVPLAETKFWWHAELAGSDEVLGPWVVYPTATVETRFDYNRENTATGVAATSTSILELDLISGEARKSCTIVDDVATKSRFASWNALPSSVPPAEVQATTIFEETRTLTNDPAIWWLGRVDSRTELHDFTGPYPAPSARPATTVDKPSNPATPLACPSTTPSPNAKSLRTDYVWYPNSAPYNYRRRLNSQALTPGLAGTVVETRTTYSAYDAYGNLTRKDVDARGIAGTLASTYTYSSGGYFPATETNAVGHTSTVAIDRATGQVKARQAVQGGPWTTTQYDSLGRALAVTTDGDQPVYERLAACAGCGDAVMARQRIGPGTPGITEYIDRLGRVIRSDTEKFDGGPPLLPGAPALKWIRTGGLGRTSGTG